MKSRIIDWWIRIQASYWFIPSLMAIGALASSFIVVYLDTRLGDTWLEDFRWLYANQPAGARALLSTVAGSMITVAGVTFSMTLLAVSHASAQIGPRLMTGFMRDRANQFTLGTFIATFLYCLMVLRTVHAGDGGPQDAISPFVPHLAVLVAVAFAILSVVVLIYFIHHVPQSISVPNVVARVGDELVDSIQSLFPERIGESGQRKDDDCPLSAELLSSGECLYLEREAGYLRVLDSEGLLELAVEHDLIVELLKRPGDFAVPGQVLLKVYGFDELPDELKAELQGLFSWGNERTREQDVMFPVEQLNEVLGKAMSPGINGQYTALLCLDQFERALAALLCRNEAAAQRYDGENRLRVIATPVTREAFVRSVLEPARQFVKDDWIATNHLIAVLRRLGDMPALASSARLLANELAAIENDVKDGAMTPSEKRRLLKTDC